MRRFLLFAMLLLTGGLAWGQSATSEERALMPVIQPGTYKTTDFFNLVLEPSSMGSALQKKLYESIWPQKVGVVFLPTNTRVKVTEAVEFPYSGSESSKGGGLDMGSYTTKLLLSAVHVEVLDGKEVGKNGWFIATGVKRRYRIEKVDFPARLYQPIRIKKDP